MGSDVVDRLCQPVFRWSCIPLWFSPKKVISSFSIYAACFGDFECSNPALIASSRRSVSLGAAQKTAREKIKKSAFYIFSRAVFCAAPWLTEHLEEARPWSLYKCSFFWLAGKTGLRICPSYCGYQLVDATHWGGLHRALTGNGNPGWSATR